MVQLVKVIPAELTELRTASTTGGGTALTSTATGTGTPLALGIDTIPFGARYLSITPRNFSGVAVVRVALNPYLTIFHTTDTGKSVTDISDEAQDGDATDINLDSFPATGDGFLYMGARIPFRGVAVNIGTGAQSTSNTLLVKFWDGDGWTAVSGFTDSTDTGASFAVDGTVVWSVASNWVSDTLKAIGDTLPPEDVQAEEVPSFAEPKYWLRWEWDNAFDSDTDIQEIVALNRSTSVAELIEGQTLEVMVTNRELGNIQCITNAGTANVLINVGTLPGTDFEVLT